MISDNGRAERLSLCLMGTVEGETLAALLVRVGSDWDLEKAAAANAIESSATFHRSDPVKVTQRERVDSRR